MRTVGEIKQDILNLTEADYTDLCRWVQDQDRERREREFDDDVRADKLDALAAEALPAEEPLQQLTESSAITPLEEWRLFPLRVAKRWGIELYNLQGFIHYSSSIGRLYARLALEIWPGTPTLPDPSFFNVDYRRISGSVKRITYIIVL